MAAAGLLLVMAVLGVLDASTRAATEPSGAPIVGLAVAIGMAAVGAALIDWNRLHWPWWRLAPAVVSLAAVLASIVLWSSAATSHAAIGLGAAAVVIMAYVGFVLPPGSAFFFSPLVVLVVLAAHLREEFRISLALPLVAVPIAAMLGELISALTDRSVRTTDRVTSRTDRLARLEDVLRRFSRPTSLAEAANEVAVAAVEIFDVPRSTVVLRNSQGELIPVTVGPASNEVPTTETALLVTDAIGGEQPRLVPSGPNQHLLVLPLPTADAPAGAVVVHPVVTDDPDFTLDLARLFGTQVGIAIEHLFVIDQLERATTRDALTGIGNRKHADALLESLQDGDAVILLDLDGFKEVNDTAGHAAGDAVLLALTAHLQRCLRDSDTSARLGGDEFLVVARRAFADPLAVADRILVGWSRGGRSTTLSAGVALHRPDVAITETLRRADEALYEAKAAGKNRAHMWFPRLIDLTDPAADNGTGPDAHGVAPAPPLDLGNVG
ncbi:MAG: diguanylate cyclase [Acidimicrobiales bacterium]